MPIPGPTILTFVNSHLAAFDEMVDKRNADFHDLSKRLLFESVDPLPGPAGAVPGQSPLGIDKVNVFESDVLFWMVSWFPLVSEYSSVNTSYRAASTLYQQICLSSDINAADLNYRIDLPDEDVRGILSSPYWDKKFEILQQYDQVHLLICQKALSRLISDISSLKAPFDPQRPSTSLWNLVSIISRSPLYNICSYTLLKITLIALGRIVSVWGC